MALRRGVLRVRRRAVPGGGRRPRAGRLRGTACSTRTGCARSRAPREVQRSRFAGPLRRLLHPANTTAPANVARMEELLKADTPDRNPRILVIGGGTVGDGLEELYDDPTRRPHRVRRLRQPRDPVRRRRPLDPARGRQRRRRHRPGGARARAGADRRRRRDPPRAPRPAASSTRTRRSSSRSTRAPTTSPGSPTAATGSCSAASSGSTPGTVAGAGTALRWSVDYFVRALTRSVSLGRIASLCFFWLSYLDRFLDPKHSRRRREQRLLPRPQDRGADHRRRHRSTTTRAACRRAHRRPHRRRHLRRERGADVPRRRRALGGPPGRGRRHPRGLRPRSRASCTASTTPAGPRSPRVEPNPAHHALARLRRRSATTCSSSPRTSTTCTSAPARPGCCTCTASCCPRCAARCGGRSRVGRTTWATSRPARAATPRRCAPTWSGSARSPTSWTGSSTRSRTRPVRLDRHLGRGLPGGRLRPGRVGVRRPHARAQPGPERGQPLLRRGPARPAGELVPAWVDELLG